LRRLISLLILCLVLIFSFQSISFAKYPSYLRYKRVFLVKGNRVEVFDYVRWDRRTKSWGFETYTRVYKGLGSYKPLVINKVGTTMSFLKTQEGPILKYFRDGPHRGWQTRRKGHYSRAKSIVVCGSHYIKYSAKDKPIGKNTGRVRLVRP